MPRPLATLLRLQCVPGAATPRLGHRLRRERRPHVPAGTGSLGSWLTLHLSEPASPSSAGKAPEIKRDACDGPQTARCGHTKCDGCSKSQPDFRKSGSSMQQRTLNESLLCPDTARSIINRPGDSRRVPPGTRRRTRQSSCSRGCCVQVERQMIRNR